MWFQCHLLFCSMCSCDKSDVLCCATSHDARPAESHDIFVPLLVQGIWEHLTLSCDCLWPCLTLHPFNPLSPPKRFYPPFPAIGPNACLVCLFRRCSTSSAQMRTSWQSPEGKGGARKRLRTFVWGALENYNLP
jgi:hypothetical protein